MTRSNNLQRVAAVLVVCALQLPVGANNNDNSRDSRDGYNYYDNENNNSNNGNDGDNDGNVLTRFADRVGYDMSDMWQTAPNTWAAEYWEVFVAVAGIAFVLLGLHCCMAYDMCCGSNDDADRCAVAGARLAMTHEQMEERRLQKEKEEQLLADDNPLQQSGENKEEFEKDLAKTRQLQADVPKLTRPVGPFDAARTTATSTSAPPPVESKKPTDYWNDVKRRSRRAYRVGAEVVSLWSEFLSDLMPQQSRDNKSNGNDSEDGDTDNNYKYRQHRHADEGSSMGRHSRKSATSSRRSPSRHRRQSRRSVDVGSPIDESAPSSSRPADNIYEQPNPSEIRGFV